jgi:very-short-patch-repair endonuclease
VYLLLAIAPTNNRRKIMKERIRSFKYFFDNYNIEDFVNENSLESMSKIFRVDFSSKDHIITYLNFIKNNPSTNLMHLRKYYKESFPNFDIERYSEYLEYRKINPYDSWSKKFYQLKLGKDRDQIEIHKSNPYDLDYIMDRDKCSKEEAQEKINDLKKKTSGSLATFIERHGEEGLERFLIFAERSARTRDKFASDEEYEKYCKSKNSMSDDYFQKKYGDKWREEKEKRLSQTTINFDKFLEKHKDYDSAVEEYKKYLQSKTGHLRKFAQATTESLEFFDKIISWLDSKNIKYYVGKEPSKEMFLYDHKTHTRKFYDFTIPDFKYIIEFHGRSHPHPTLDDPKKWINKYDGKSFQETVEKDQYKKQLAESYGFQIDEIHYKDFKQNRSNVIKTYIKKLEKMYEDYINRKVGN